MGYLCFRCPSPTLLPPPPTSTLQREGERLDTLPGKIFSLRGIVMYFFSTLFNTALSAAPSDSTLSEDDEPKTVATLTLAVRRSNPSAFAQLSSNIFFPLKIQGSTPSDSCLSQRVS
jgi:hypothetical protein